MAITVSGCARGLSEPEPGAHALAVGSPTIAEARVGGSQSFQPFGQAQYGARPLSTARILGIGSQNGGSPLEVELPEGVRPLPKNGLCPPDMASIDDLYCVDRYEASLIEIASDGVELPWPYYLPTEGHIVRAVSEKGVSPQGYISERQAIDACGRSGKRLCKPAEWKKACRGPENKKFGYGDVDEPRRCNNYGVSPVTRFWGLSGDLSQIQNWDWQRMNAPELNQMPDTIAKTGDHEGCTNGYGVYDMVGNLHEWVDDPEGTFEGGYFQDTHLNGDGCGYRTDAHAAWYHDYSTGFRCCADVAQ